MNDYREPQNGYQQQYSQQQGFIQQEQVQSKPSMHVTTLNDLQSYAGGNIIELPPFGNNQPFIARLRRPSLMILAKQGKIPNSLLATANGLFTGTGAQDTDSENMLGEMLDVCRIICEASLISPTLSEIDNAGLDLTDEQMLAIFNYSQGGAKALEPFRKE